MKRILGLLALVCGLVSWCAGLEEAVLRDAASRWIARSVVLKQAGVDFRVLGMEPLKDDEGSPLPMVAMSLEPDGFLVICTDDRLPTVLAFSPTGRFSNDAEGLPRLLRHQGKKYVECLAPTRGNDLQGAYAKNSEEWEALLGGLTRGPLGGDPDDLIQPAQLTTIWRQDHPFNLLMPTSSNGIAFRGVVGCVPLAYAQLMEWNQWPPRGKGQKSYENASPEVDGTLSADFTLDYNWALLEDHYFSDVFPDPITANDREVARLLLDLVVGARAAIGLESTSSGPVALAKTLESHLYYQRPTFWDSQGIFGTVLDLSVVHSKLREEVKSGWPALAMMPGHVYVVSGYGKQNNVEYFYYNYGWKTAAVINGWYRLDDGFQGAASALFGCGVGTRPLPIPMFRPINRVQGTAVTVEWDFPKRLTSQGFRLSKQVGGPGAPFVVISNAIEGTARSFNLTGLEPGNVALTLEAKVGGSWQEASEPLELTIVQGDAPVDVGLTCPVDETCFLDDTMSFDVTSQVPLESLAVTTSRVDIIPSDGILVEDLGDGMHWRVTLAPVGDREAFALLWVKGMTASGCEEAKSVFLRVLKRPMLTWYTSRDEAFEAAVAENKLVFLVFGSKTDYHTFLLRQKYCELPANKQLLLDDYILWFDDYEWGTGESYEFLRDNYGYYFPWTAVIMVDDQGNGTTIRWHNGETSGDQLMALLDTSFIEFTVPSGSEFEIGMTLEVGMGCMRPGTVIRYTLDGSEPTNQSQAYSRPLVLGRTTTIKARMFLDGEPIKETAEATYYNRDPNYYVIPGAGAAVGLPNTQFMTTGNANWFVQTAEYSSAPSALRSGSIGDDEESQLIMYVQGNGTLSFDWKVNSEYYDYLELFVDGEQTGEWISGDVAWDSVSFEVRGGGRHKIVWKYWKDAYYSEGKDCGWVDNVEWIPGPKAICVTLYPEGVGAWRIAGSGNWLDSGEAEEVETGTYAIEFQDVEGWTAPAQRTITVGDVEVGLMESYSPVLSGGGFGVLVTANWTGGDMPKSLRLMGGVATNQDVEAPFDVPAWLEADNEAKLVDFEAPDDANSLQWTLEASVIGTESLQLIFTNVNIPENWELTVTDSWGENVALDTPIVLDSPGHYCYEIRLDKYLSQEVILRPGWTLLSLALIPNPNSNFWNYEPKTLANGNYIPVENLNPGDAFWIFNDGTQGVQTFQILGMAPNNDEVEANTAKIQNLKPGTWTFIGTLNELILDASEFLIWEWGDNGYQRPADNKLIPEKGYWLKRK